ncbi:MAG: lipocalin-like domain-containing protein [Pseudomonadota bacterium]
MKQIVTSVLMLIVAACSDGTKDNDSTVVSLHGELGGDANGFARACAPRDFVFPQDHLAHPDFRNEWWYVTGNVATPDSLKLGFHATFFRVAALAPQQAASESAWETSQFYMAHFAVTREGDTRVSAHERFARSAAGLAGTRLENAMASVWLEDWTLTQTKAGDAPVWQLRLADENSAAIDVQLSANKPRVLQGNQGYSQKSADPCNASYYYAYTRLHTEGQITVDGIAYPVEGSSWLDREWSSSALADNQVGWDWFALQLNDARDIMFYQLRESNGQPGSFSSAVEIDADGVKRTIAVPVVEVDRWWQSDSGARYPVAGRLIRKDSAEVIHFTPLIDNQELNLTVRYWEGAIQLFDELGNHIGQGYLELTGY